MKTAYTLIFSTIVIVGGFVLFHSINNIQPVSSVANNPVPTQTPLLISPTPTGILSTKTLAKIQLITATYSLAFGLQPKIFNIKAGIPTRLEINSADNGQGCMGSVVIPILAPRDIRFFTKGEASVFEFTPTIPGTYQITCAMGVPHGTITVE